ncbi:NAD(P)H-binding protein [uncultured Maricaulis sp.]|uniref:NAD(P)H-binding protein n=1 Tax=uncultured Maricaulis sp. TaxID=174710 RepID=UPI0030DA8623
MFDRKTAKPAASRHPVNQNGLILVVGATGKTGRRVAEGLMRMGHAVRLASRNAAASFDWDKPAGWAAVLTGVSAVYLTFAPDLAVPGATEAITAFVGMAKTAGVGRIVLLSGRGEDEAQAAERIVQASGMDWTIVRASWFNQNFTEGEFVHMVQAGEIALPAGDALEPFVDANDIAEVAIAALTQAGHASEVYDVTGPRLMSFAAAAAEISAATGRAVRFVDIPHEAFIDALVQSGAPEGMVWLLDYLFATVLDGRNARLGDGVERALGRKPVDFLDFAHDAAGSGAWSLAA